MHRKHCSNSSPTDKVGIGTIVDIEDLTDGSKDTYTILGAWDGDVENNVIAYLSETAKALIGHVPGDEVEVPTEAHNTTRKVRINAIRPYAQLQPA